MTSCPRLQDKQQPSKRTYCQCISKWLTNVNLRMLYQKARQRHHAQSREKTLCLCSQQYLPFFSYFLLSILYDPCDQSSGLLVEVCLRKRSNTQRAKYSRAYTNVTKYSSVHIHTPTITVNFVYIDLKLSEGLPLLYIVGAAFILPIHFRL